MATHSEADRSFIAGLLSCTKVHARGLFVQELLSCTKTEYVWELRIRGYRGPDPEARFMGSRSDEATTAACDITVH
ncbi:MULTISPECIES: hypothetical protein [Corynebacterium]|uniref:hypothetical protein n=1 Tax=Corynebacterium TaxID=1716 RepID=UPI0019566947|nr:MULTISPECIES: hypothetical protein [Corynebacterium]MDN8624650.1 hypothetical protein [Corynebacterium kroppenstedtii]QRQ65725.1 hypothetical protein I6J23_04740 [Corynebacterium kroppenstedtii]